MVITPWDASAVKAIEKAIQESDLGINPANDGKCLRLLFPQTAQDRSTMDSISANVSANLLGLGNAATPLGIRAARRMARGCGGTASDELCTLVVLNTASIQLIPATVGSLRAAMGSAAPFDILPAVWLSSVLSVTAGLAAARLFSLPDRRRT